MNVTKMFRCLLTLTLTSLAAFSAHAEVVEYTLENVILDDSNAQMHGTFLWSYEVGDFENGEGEFTFLEIPFTWHDHTDLDATFDVGNSIEITLEGSVHDDGVDITLFLLEPLTPTSGSEIDLDRSKYEIGGNGFHDGLFLSGSVEVSGAADVGENSSSPTNRLTAFPNPFEVHTTVSYFVAQPGFRSISVHDASGRLISTLVEGWQGAGFHSVPWSGVGLESGLYFVRYASNSASRTEKVVLLQ